jgi:hypothetical protein
MVPGAWKVNVTVTGLLVLPKGVSGKAVAPCVVDATAADVTVRLLVIVLAVCR